MNAQRLLYLYEMLNIVIVSDKVYLLPVKERVVEKLMKMKGLNEDNLNSIGKNYEIVEESIDNLKQTLESLRKKIPRLGNQIADNEK